MRRAFSIAATALFLSGCGANFTTAYRTFEPVEDGPKNALIDAKQRALFVVPGTMSTMTGEGRRKVLVCAEPSPDALSAISSSLSASFGGLFPSGANVQAALAAALSETASQLGVRNATIQLLRDGLYRQCEAYMNGLIGADYYEQIANKYVNAMVALLAIEQLAPVSASATSIRASGGGKVSTKTSVNVKSVMPTEEPEKEDAEPEDKPEDGESADPNATDSNANPDTSTAGGTSDTGTTEEAELDSSGSNQASADAAAPVTSVNLPSGNQRTIPGHVSSAVGTMVTFFLTKDTVDYCLRELREIEPAQRTKGDAFIDACVEVIQDQMTQQEQYLRSISVTSSAISHNPDKCSSAIIGFWKPNGKQNADRLSKIREAIASTGDAVDFSDLLYDDQFVPHRKRVGTLLNLADCK